MPTPSVDVMAFPTKAQFENLIDISDSANNQNDEKRNLRPLAFSQVRAVSILKRYVKDRHIGLWTLSHSQRIRMRGRSADR